MIFKNYQFNFSFILTVALLNCCIFASEIENSVSEPVGRKANPSFNKIAIDFVEMMITKLESGEYVMTPREELIYTLVLDIFRQSEKEKMDKLRKVFMYMRHVR